MSDKSLLLDSLKIERVPVRRGGPSPLLVGALAAALLLAAGGAWYFWPDSRVPVHVVTASAGSGGSAGGSDLDASGYVVARRTATLSAKIQGKVTEVDFEEGQKVKAGEIVARLDDSNYLAILRQFQAQARQAKVALDNAAPTYARYQALNAQGALSAEDVQGKRTLYDNARTQYDVAQAAVVLAEANLRDTLVRAPFDGIVTVKVAQVGEVVAPSAAGGGSTRTGIMTIVDMNSLEVQVDVSENYIERVQPGGAATIHLDAYPDWDIPGSVIAIIPTADQSKGTVAVRVKILTKDSRILPQMAARVSFMTAPEKNAGPVMARVTVPPAAVMVKGKTGTVFVLKDDGVVEKRDVALGLKTAQAVTILSGITAGDRLAGDGLDKLHDGDKVKILDQN
ncbi:MAG: efflux RND transporter periplasmic adaptor subunit [Alphaproteobacteria bacterium]|nr:efflux RND transporter periplasmic adaptor subunit [Alphaproteobacteria bacterium]